MTNLNDVAATTNNIIHQIPVDIQTPHGLIETNEQSEMHSSDTGISLQAFIRHVLPDDGYKCDFVIKDKKPQQHFVKSLEELDAQLKFFDDAGCETFFGCASYINAESRKQENVAAAKAFWLDIDAGKDKNGKDKPYPDAGAAYEAVREFCVKTELPFPIIVYSGSGLHVWWTLDRVISREEWKPIAEALKELTEYHGLKADPSRTADIASVLRAPGTHHRKNSDNPKLVVCHKLEAYVSAEKFMAEIMRNFALMNAKKMAASVPVNAASNMPDVKATNYDNAPSSSLAKVAEHCAQLRNFRDTEGNISEPEWYADICVAAHCEDGEALAHGWSSGHSKYTKKETDEKLDHALKDSGPTTCARFEFLNPDGCNGCQYKGTITSPIQLGKTKLPAILPSRVQEKIRELAALPPFAYEIRRDEEAQKLGVRVPALDKEVQRIREQKTEGASREEMFKSVELWPEEINGAELLDEIYDTVRRFIVCNEEVARAVTLWIAFTWFVDCVQVAPLAVITAPEKKCGKTQLLDVIGRLSCRSLTASNISPAAVFRVIEAHSPTLLIDEADSFFGQNEELRGIINSGHTRQSAYVLRTIGDDHEPKRFSTWGAKAISGIGKMHETIMDRAIVLELRRKLPSEKVGRLRHAETGLFDNLSSKLARFSHDAKTHIQTARPLLPEALNDRAQDNWEPMFAIADHVGGEWPEHAQKTALALSGEQTQQDQSIRVNLLADIRDMFIEHNTDRLASSMACSNLALLEDRPWAEYGRHGKPITPAQLAKLLKEHGITSKDIRMDEHNLKGYTLDQFKDAFARYLPDLPATPLQH